jgi:chromosome segregation ATPase
MFERKQEELKSVSQELMNLRISSQKLESADKSLQLKRKEDQEKIVSLQQQLSEKMDEFHNLNTTYQEMEIELFQAKRQLDIAEKNVETYKKEIGVFKELRCDYEVRIQTLTTTVSQLA